MNGTCDHPSAHISNDPISSTSVGNLRLISYLTVLHVEEYFHINNQLQ